MAVVFVENVVEIVVAARYGLVPIVSVWHMYSEEEGVVNDEALVQDFANNWQDHIVPQLSQAYDLDAFEWRSLDPDDTNAGVILPDPLKPVTGITPVGDAAPGNVAALVHKNTSNRPRGRRDGRCFLPGVTEGQVGPDGTLSNAAIDGYNAALEDFYNGVTDSSGVGAATNIRVLETTPASRAPGNQVVVIGSRVVSSLSIDPIVGTQRDRTAR